jgi:bifunctional non-homologous end joining protein LigD
VALEKYKAKRNFNESPEPSGDKTHTSPSGRATRFFCVQKHLASHLHYDFRLEHNGVLLSWAVPKGPSLDPATKRLAMHVEDHPIEYGEFEGVIPSGYGAGIVMLWDVGTWVPEVADVEGALKKGDLKFTLEGVKLKGSWVLVRTKGGGWGSRSSGGGDRAWLLIKHRDDWAGPVDIAEFAPLSVKTRGDFADILASGNPDIWHSHRPAQGGEAGAMFERIVARALELREQREGRGAEGAERATRSRAPHAEMKKTEMKKTGVKKTGVKKADVKKAGVKTGVKKTATAGRTTAKAGRARAARPMAARATAAKATKTRAATSGGVKRPRARNSTTRSTR